MFLSSLQEIRSDMEVERHIWRVLQNRESIGNLRAWPSDIKILKENQGILSQVRNHNCKWRTVGQPTCHSTGPLIYSEKGVSIPDFKCLTVELRRRIHGLWIKLRSVFLACHLLMWGENAKFIRFLLSSKPVKGPTDRRSVNGP